MTAHEVKEALRERHPAIAYNPLGPGPWTCLEEWSQIDLLAFAAWTKPSPARARFARVGYEVKVSRADYKRELERPGKRAFAVALCHEFYFATPAGLLKDDEKAWEPPTRFGVDYPPFWRPPCPGAFGYRCHAGELFDVGVVDRRTSEERRGFVFDWRACVGKIDRSRTYSAVCPTCRGVGWLQESAVARAGAPRLWVPPDVGLVEVHTDGRVVVVRKSPVVLEPTPLTDRQVTDLVRWTSVRPDPRHVQLRRERIADTAG